MSLSDQYLVDVAPVTTGRKSRLRLDVPKYQIAEYGWWLTRKANEIGLGTDSRWKNTILDPASNSIELAPKQLEQTSLHDAADVQSSIKKPVADGGTLQTANNVSSLLMARPPSDQTGASTGSSGTLSSAGDPFIQKQIPASDNWDSANNTISVDETAMPTVEDWSWILTESSPYQYASDRVVVDTVNHDPNQAFFWRFYIPGSAFSNHRNQIVKYFCGPPSDMMHSAPQDLIIVDMCYRGTGIYALVCHGDGSGFLAQRYKKYRAEGAEGHGEYIWHVERPFRYAQAGQVVNRTHTLYVRPRLFKAMRGDCAGSISIAGAYNETQSRKEARTSPWWNAPLLMANQGTQDNYRQFAFKARQKTPYRLDSDPAPMREDHLRPSRPMTQTVLAKYETSGYVFDDWVSFPSFSTYSTTAQVEWYGQTPAGTGISIEIYDQAGQLVTPSGSGTWGTVGGYVQFSAGASKTTYRVKISLTGDGNQTPSLFSYRFNKNPAYTLVAPGEKVIKLDRRQGVSITGPSKDPSTETAGFTVEDPTNTVDILSKRSSVPLIIDTRYDGVDWSNPANEGRQSVLFEGYLERANGIKKGRNRIKALGSTDLPAWPSSEWHGYDCQAVGEWLKLAEAIAPFNMDLAFDPTTYGTGTEGPQPYLVTSVIRWLLEQVYPPDEVQIPDLPLRMFPNHNNDSIRLNVGMSPADLALKLAQTYFGSTIWRDSNAGVGTDPTQWRGMWRLLVPPTPPYNFLAKFYLDGMPTIPGAPEGSVYLGHVDGAYPKTGDQVGTFIQRRSFKTYIKRPEANLVIVSGTGNITGDTSITKLTQIACNYKSFNFISGETTADPNHPDYLGRVVPFLYVDPNLATEFAVNYVTWRLYHMITHGIKCATFVAPLILVTDSTDAYQKRPRKLKVWDPVQINDTTWLVRSCTPTFTKDKMQMAVYEVEAPREPYV